MNILLVLFFFWVMVQMNYSGEILKSELPNP